MPIKRLLFYILWGSRDVPFPAQGRAPRLYPSIYSFLSNQFFCFSSHKIQEKIKRVTFAMVNRGYRHTDLHCPPERLALVVFADRPSAIR